jgi:hypothetical protein
MEFLLHSHITYQAPRPATVSGPRIIQTVAGRRCSTAADTHDSQRLSAEGLRDAACVHACSPSLLPTPSPYSSVCAPATDCRLAGALPHRALHPHSPSLRAAGRQPALSFIPCAQKPSFRVLKESGRVCTGGYDAQPKGWLCLTSKQYNTQPRLLQMLPHPQHSVGDEEALQPAANTWPTRAS